MLKVAGVFNKNLNRLNCEWSNFVDQNLLEIQKKYYYEQYLTQQLENENTEFSQFLRESGGTGKLKQKDLESNKIFDESFITSQKEDYHAVISDIQINNKL